MDHTEAQALLQLHEAGLNAMLDLSDFIKQRAKISEGLAAFQILISHVPGAIVTSPTQAHNLESGDADGDAIGSMK